MEPVSLYCHIPFCRKRCHYCHFVSTNGRLNDIDRYVQALGQEIDQVYQSYGGKIGLHSIYFGGGTPSLLPLPLFEGLIKRIESSFHFLNQMEITLEANPGSLNLEYLTGLHKMGFNRISIGAQSIHSQDLALLGRSHTSEQITLAVEWSRAAGFNNLSLDLMFGFPGQRLTGWEQTLEQITKLKPDHLSLYELTIEKGTYLEKLISGGEVKEVEQDLAADMYETAIDYLETNGYEQYEISNWAARSADRVLTCKHNLQYWKNLAYLGLGVGAFGYIDGYRTENTPDLDAYIQAFYKSNSKPFPESQATLQLTPVSKWDEIQDTMMLGLRLTRDGINERRFYQRFGKNLEVLFEKEINHLIKQNLLEWIGGVDDRSLRLTRRGRPIGNRVFVEFIGLAER